MAKTYNIFQGDDDAVNGPNTSEREATTRARATAVKGFDGNGNAIYAGSDRTNHKTEWWQLDNYTWDNYEYTDSRKGGRALRTESLRIRACYVGPLLDEP